MNWKATIILAVLTVGTFATWFLVQPTEEVDVVRPRPFEWPERTYQSITIRMPDQPEIVLKRKPALVQGSFWHLDKSGKPADDNRIADMIAALRQLTRNRAIKPGDPEHTPSTYGLDKPVASVEVSAAGERRTVLFGNASVKQPSYRFFMIEGEPEIFWGPVGTSAPFQRGLVDLRSRKILPIESGRVIGVEVSQRFLRPGSQDKPGLKGDYDKLRFEFREQPTSGRKGWYLVSINGEKREEKAEDSKLGLLISGLRDLQAEEYVMPAEGADLGFKEPETIVRMEFLQLPENAQAPVVVELGKTEDKGNRKVSYVRIDGGPEVSMVSAASVDRLPRERKQFIPLNLIDFDPQTMDEVELVTYTGHRVKVVKRVKDEPRGNETFKTVIWEVVEPANLPVETNALIDFVNWLPQVSVMDILGEQPDLKIFGLDPPGITMTLRFRNKAGERQERVFTMGRAGDSKYGHGYLMKGGSRDVYQLSEEAWRRFERGDLNFRQSTMFNLPSNDAIVGVAFSYKPDHLSANPVRYSIKRVAKDKWEFEGGPAGAKVDPELVDYLLGSLNFIKAESFITRDPRGAKDLELIDADSMGRLTIKYADPANPGKSAEKSFRFSKSFPDPSGRTRLYYAKMEPSAGDNSPSSDATIVFRIKTEVVEALRKGVLFEVKAPEQFK